LTLVIDPWEKLKKAGVPNLNSIASKPLNQSATFFEPVLYRFQESCNIALKKQGSRERGAESREEGKRIIACFFHS
jgi:hypothetical protein